ncbi:hypothetical protein [Paenibacillus taichungensis]|uniref:hypothetical protein n=1 Tax=Paenibacillus taichungensis TaxID=484184 RepID=UPI002871BE0D|nr:hypothetical protein [Paenibacillus taichungensis]MDR9747857.1 hypothetical protein [Paenibacillus taichungensis]
MTEEWTIESFDMDKNRTLILTPEYLYVKIPKEDALRFVTEGKQGNWEWTDNVNSKDVVHLSSIHRVKANKKDSMVDMDLDNNSLKKYNFYFFIDEPEIKQQFLEKLHSYLNESHTYEEKQVSPLKSAFKPLLTLFITAAVSFILAYLASDPLEPGKSYKVRLKVKVLFDFLTDIGPVPIIITASLIALITVMVMFARIKNPPLLVSLQRK